MFFIVSSWRHIFGPNIQIDYLRFSDFEVHQEIQSCEAGRGRHGLGAAWRHGARLALSKRLREQLSRSRYAHWGRVLGRSSVSEGTPSHVEGVGAQATPQPCADHNVAHTLWVLKAFHLSPATRCACPAWAVCAPLGRALDTCTAASAAPVLCAGCISPPHARVRRSVETNSIANAYWAVSQPKLKLQHVESW